MKLWDHIILAADISIVHVLWIIKIRVVIINYWILGQKRFTKRPRLSCPMGVYIYFYFASLVHFCSMKIMWFLFNNILFYFFRERYEWKILSNSSCSSRNKCLAIMFKGHPESSGLVNIDSTKCNFFADNFFLSDWNVV